VPGSLYCLNTVIFLPSRRAAQLVGARAAQTARRPAVLLAAVAVTCGVLAGFAVPAGAAVVPSGPAGGPFPFTVQPPVGVAAAPAGGFPATVPASLKTPGSAGAPPRQEFVPDLIAAAPTGITSAQLAKIAKLTGVRTVLPVNGGEITVNGKSADVLGVSPAFRSWTPPSTAALNAVWTDLGKGQLVSTHAAATKLHLAAGHTYQVSAAVRAQVPFGAPTALSVPGVDAIVDQARSAQLGLVKNVAVLINAPGADLSALISKVQSVIGGSGKVRNLVAFSVVTVNKLPVATNVPTAGVPKSLMTLYQESAEEYCPGMSWTVLAAINEIESDDGANEGPSSAGALGPMQFIPSTWAEWGIDGFGQTGTPDIMDPLDAVPSAARLLCAAGAGKTATLSASIFAYNHATWYVAEVLALAGEYARDYS
jgi:Transglycosylase SLT domain